MVKNILQTIALKLINSIEVWTDIVNTELVNRIAKNYFPNIKFNLFNINEDYISYPPDYALVIIIIVNENNITKLEHLLETKNVILMITTSKNIYESYKHKVNVLVLNFVKT
jgi:hypothetical protein